MYYIALDGGTTNTRLRLITDGAVSAVKKLPLGAGNAGGKAPWSAAVAKAAKELLSENGLVEKDVTAVIASGMVTSEYGLYPLAHLPSPAGIADLHAGMAKTEMEGLSIPCFFIPGVKQNAASAEDADMMRGEEAEVIGLLSFGGAGCTYVLPGTHCKIVRVDETGKIVEIYTSMSGELLDLVVKNSILADQVRHGASLSERDLLDGKAYAHEYGVPAALFHIRVMEKNGIPSDRLSSFLYGAVLGQDVELIEGITSEDRVLIGGKESLCQIYGALLKHRGTKLSKDVAEYATRNGLGMLYRLYREG